MVNEGGGIHVDGEGMIAFGADRRSQMTRLVAERGLRWREGRRAADVLVDEHGGGAADEVTHADMATELEAARSLLWRAAAALDAKDPEATRLCAMAKRVATDAGFAVANDALQLHGGYGYLAEYGIEKIVRDLRVHQILEGTNEIMRMIVARGLVGRGNRG
jgi:hypothetical protein